MSDSPDESPCGATPEYLRAASSWLLGLFEEVPRPKTDGGMMARIYASEARRLPKQRKEANP